jgi:hypothetical protein
MLIHQQTRSTTFFQCYQVSQVFKVFLLLALCVGYVGSQPTDFVRSLPRQIVNVVESLQRETAHRAMHIASSRFKIKDVSQAAGMWAVLMPSTSTDAAVMLGDRTSTHSFVSPGVFERIMLDDDRSVHLLSRYKPGDNARVVSVVDDSGKVADTYTLSTSSAIPFLGTSGIGWRAPTGFFRGPTASRISFQRTYPAPDAEIEQRVIAGMTRSGAYFTFGELSEAITVYGADGRIAHSYAAPLDAAYRLIGGSVPKMPVSTERSRVVWSSASRDGRLYVCLSGLPIAGPAYIAVVEPDSGRLLQVISADLPSLPTRISSSNPTGHIMPSLGAVGDMLVIADQIDGLVVLY